MFHAIIAKPMRAACLLISTFLAPDLLTVRGGVKR
jgi:hypothetical protein